MDRKEIDSLYRRLGPTIYRRCLRLLGDDQMARDATQEVFMRSLQQAERLQDDRGCLPWLYRVSTNYCLDRLRERQRRPEPVAHESVTPDEPGPEAQVSARQRVRALLARLDPRDQRIALLHYLDRMTQDEIGEVLELSRRTVGKRLKNVQAVARALGEEITP